MVKLFSGSKKQNHEEIRMISTNDSKGKYIDFSLNANIQGNKSGKVDQG